MVAERDSADIILSLVNVSSSWDERLRASGKNNVEGVDGERKKTWQRDSSVACYGCELGEQHGEIR